MKNTQLNRVVKQLMENGTVSRNWALERYITFKPKTTMKKPKNWRKGQMIFNFLEYCLNHGVPANQNARLADTFHLSDRDYDKLWDDFNKEIR